MKTGQNKAPGIAPGGSDTIDFLGDQPGYLLQSFAHG